MEVKEAVNTAIEYIIDLYADEPISEVGLEEVSLDPERGEWKVTVGFSRPWDAKTVIEAPYGPVHLDRVFKLLHLRDVDGQVLSVTDRLLAAAN